MCRESKIDFSRYIVKENGEIISKFKNSLLTTQNVSGLGYVINTYRNIDGKQETYTRHRVIWYYFNGDIPEGMQIGHKDSSPSNNSLDNLYLCTAKENMENVITRARLSSQYRNQERNRKISESLKGRIVSEEQKRKQSLAMSGCKHPFWGRKRPLHSELMKKADRDAYGRFKKGA